MLSRKLEQRQEQSQGHSVSSLVLPTHINHLREVADPPESLIGQLGTGYTQVGLYTLKLAPGLLVAASL